MPSRIRLRNVCRSIAHRAVSGLSYVHPHVLRVCRSAGVGCMQVNLIAVDPCPPQFADIVPLSLSLRALREKFEAILTAEVLCFADLSFATLCFAPDPGKDNYCSICRATLKCKDREPVEYIVNYLGQTLHAIPCGQQQLAHKAMKGRLP